MTRNIHDRRDELLDHHRDQVTADQRQSHAHSQPLAGPRRRHDREGFSFDEGFSSNKRKILRDQDQGHAISGTFRAYQAGLRTSRHRPIASTCSGGTRGSFDPASNVSLPAHTLVASGG
jgi:hypothetical protein